MKCVKRLKKGNYNNNDNNNMPDKNVLQKLGKLFSNKH